MFKEVLSSDKRSTLFFNNYEDRLNILSTYNLNDLNIIQQQQQSTQLTMQHQQQQQQHQYNKQRHDQSDIFEHNSSKR
jgi:predicted transcriptional regulator